MTDTYAAGDAARVLGCSERLVRKYAASGRLETVQEHPLRISQESVHRVRAERKGSSRTGKPAAPQGIVLDAEQLQTLIQTAVAAAISQTSALMLETRDAVERHLADELAAARLEIERLRADLDDAKDKPKWRKRKKGKRRKDK